MSWSLVLVPSKAPGKFLKRSMAQVGQGQLQLTRCRGEHFEQEVFFPAATAAFHDDTHTPVGMLFRER